MTALTLRPADELRPSSRLLSLLPGIYRYRIAAITLDAEPQSPPPVEDLIAVLGRGLDDLYDAIEQLWDDHFVERADAAALPLLAELYGAQLLSRDPRAQRALIARIVGWRRTKGTLVTLEDVASATSTWDSEVDEGFRSVIATLELSQLAPWRGRTAMLWDPIGLSDPLTRRSLAERRPRGDDRRERGQVIAMLPGEELDDTLHRLGRVDAGMYAASPRVLDLRGWARPDAVLVRSSRFVAVELENVEPEALVALPHGQRGGWIDPAGRDTPLAWLHPVARPDLAAGLTVRHEPAPVEEPLRVAAGLLTPTALAEDPDRAERVGAFSLAVDGIVLVGPPRPVTARGALVAQPIGDEPVLKLAEPARPSPGDVWRISVIAALPDVDDPTPDDILLASADLGPAGAVTPITIGPDANVEMTGRTVDLIVERVAGVARQRASDGTWSELALDSVLGRAVSNTAVVDVGSDTWIARIERHQASGKNRLVRAIVGAPTWTALPSLPAPLDTAEGVALIGNTNVLLAVARVDDTLGVFRISDLAGAGAVNRLDTESPRKPRARRSPSLAIHDGRLYVYGGDEQGAAAGDMWSIALGGGVWRPHPIRRQEERVGATLLSTPAGLVLLGGDAVPGTLTRTCKLWALATSRSWRPLPTLSLDDGPGLLVARTTTTGIEALVWADRTRPVRCFLPTGADAWQVGAIEAEGPNPPALGESVFVGDRFLMIGPAPLPSSDVVFSQRPAAANVSDALQRVGATGAAVYSRDDEGALAVLPRLSLAVGEKLRLRVASDGATFRRDPPTPAEQARPRPLDTRFGGLFADEALVGPASDHRYAQPGRLLRHPWRLAQRSLGPWLSLIEPSTVDRGLVFLDPRLGRFALPATAPFGRITVSCRVGRGGELGPGLVPPARAIRRDWLEPEPELAPVTPPDLVVHPARVEELDPHAYVALHRAGQRVSGPELHELPPGRRSIDIVRDVEAALARVPDGELGRIAILGSARVPFARLTSGVDRGISIVAADPGSTPVIDRDDRDLSLLVQTTADNLPSYWLAGLWLLGRLEISAERGFVDVRYCQLAAPGRLSLWAPGAGHQDIDARRSLPRAELEIRLYGCQLGTIELPPWSRLVAAGCTFDAGDRASVAIRAAGAAVRLRHCTVLGQVEAGKLEASSCAFAGEVRVDREDLGYVRHSLLARGGRAPRLFESLVHTVSFVTSAPTSPGYLVLADNNGSAAFAVGEGANVPGAYGERGDHERELTTRTREFLPIGMEPIHVDRTTFDLYRLGRR